MYTVYILRCADESLYVGITNNLDHRLDVHRSGKGSRYVRSRLPFTLVHTEVAANRSAALKRELALKALTKLQKEILLGK